MLRVQVTSQARSVRMREINEAMRTGTSGRRKKLPASRVSVKSIRR